MGCCSGFVLGFLAVSFRGLEVGLGCWLLPARYARMTSLSSRFAYTNLHALESALFCRTVFFLVRFTPFFSARINDKKAGPVVMLRYHCTLGDLILSFYIRLPLA